MKILRLRFQNLNSLRGPFEIDFDQAPLADAGLFLITGPTGAGKTTVLDAVTLALYGRSARYGTAPNPAEVMSRHTAECMAEVDFQCAEGRYRSVWKLRRANGAVDGNIIKERRVIYLSDGETILTQKQDESNKLVAELTGLDYDRLLRSVLLAQGDFAAFLRAKPAQRTELLERVTGAAIYSQISRAAYEEAKLAAEAHQKLEERLRDVAVLPEDLRTAKQTRLKEVDAEWSQLRQTGAELRVRVASAKQYLEYEGNLTRIESATAELLEQRARHTMELAQLERHEQAAQWAPELAEMDLLLEQWRRGTADLERIKHSLPELVSAAQTTEQMAQAAQRLAAQCERGATRYQGLFDEVTTLDQEVAQADQALEQQREQSRQAGARVNDVDKKLAEAEAHSIQSRSKFDEANTWLEARLSDKGLADAWPDMRAQLQDWLGHMRQQKASADEADQWQRTGRGHKTRLAEIEPNVVKLAEALSMAETQARTEQTASDEALAGRTEEQWDEERLRAEAAGAALQSLRAIAESHRSLVERLVQLQGESCDIERHFSEISDQVRQAAQAKDAAAALVEAKRRILDLALRVQSFEEQRHLLEPGVACPLCGSHEHPFATPHGKPSHEVAAAKRELKDCEGAMKKAERSLQDAIKLQTAHQTTLTRIAVDVARVTKEQEQCAAQWRQGAAAAAFKGPPEDGALLGNAWRAAQERQDALQRKVRLIRQFINGAQKTDALAKAARLKWMDECAKKAKVEGELQNCRQAWQAAQKRMQSERDVAAQVMTALGVILIPYGETALAQETDAAALQGRIQDRIKTHERKTQERNSAEQELAALQQKREGLAQQRQTAADDLRVAQAREQAIRDQQTCLRAKRREKFGDKSVTQERARLQRAWQAARQERDDALRMGHEAARRRDAAQQALQSLYKQTEEHQASIARSQAAVQASAQRAGFASLESLRQSLLPAAEAERRTALRGDLQSREQSLATQRETFASLRAALPADAAESAALLTDLIAQQELAEAGMQALGDERGALHEELRQDTDRRQGLAALTLAIAKAAEEKARWKRLSDLIGSATGGTFSRFAQGLTLERLVSLANQHLHHLSPRYSLRRARAEVDDLELEVIDHYQADVHRPMASLSGGESFLASLALALGLSDLASGRKAIESLFIDEGFGSLDTESLDAAMAALERLQATGKTIGLISHVSSMKERIATQIQIDKGVGGWSEVKVV